MISNEPRNLNALASLAQSTFQFYLTGSRYFGHETMESDWDFFVDASALSYGLIEWFHQNGFCRDLPRDYGSVEIAQVWVSIGAAIHVQVVADAWLKDETQDILRNNPRIVARMQALKKEERTLFWDVALVAYTAGKNARKH